MLRSEVKVANNKEGILCAANIKAISDALKKSLVNPYFKLTPGIDAAVMGIAETIRNYEIVYNKVREADRDPERAKLLTHYVRINLTTEEYKLAAAQVKKYSPAIEVLCRRYREARVAFDQLNVIARKKQKVGTLAQLEIVNNLYRQFIGLPLKEKRYTLEHKSFLEQITIKFSALHKIGDKSVDRQINAMDFILKSASARLAASLSPASNRNEIEKKEEAYFGEAIQFCLGYDESKTTLAKEYNKLLHIDTPEAEAARGIIRSEFEEGAIALINKKFCLNDDTSLPIQEKKDEQAITLDVESSENIDPLEQLLIEQDQQAEHKKINSSEPVELSKEKWEVYNERIEAIDKAKKSLLRGEGRPGELETACNLLDACRRLDPVIDAYHMHKKASSFMKDYTRVQSIYNGDWLNNQGSRFGRELGIFYAIAKDAALESKKQRERQLNEDEVYNSISKALFLAKK